MGVMKRAAGMKLSGDRAVARQFSRAGGIITSNTVAIIALSAGAGVIKKAAQARAAKYTRTGELVKSIMVKPLKKKRKDGRAVVVGPVHKLTYQRATPGGKKAFRRVGISQVAKHRAKGSVVFRNDPGNYAHLVEFGTKAHGPKTARVMKMPDGSFARRVKGTPPRPFMRPAWDTKKDAALRVTQRKLWQLFAKEMTGVV